MYKQILIPDKQNHSIILPKDMYEKKVEVTVVEIIDERIDKSTKKPKTFLDDIEEIPDFPNIEDIRREGWPEKW